MDEEDKALELQDAYDDGYGDGYRDGERNSRQEFIELRNQLEEDMLGIVGEDRDPNKGAVEFAEIKEIRNGLKAELRKAIKDYFEGEE